MKTLILRVTIYNVIQSMLTLISSIVTYVYIFTDENSSDSKNLFKRKHFFKSFLATAQPRQNKESAYSSPHIRIIIEVPRDGTFFGIAARRRSASIRRDAEHLWNGRRLLVLPCSSTTGTFSYAGTTAVGTCSRCLKSARSRRETLELSVLPVSAISTYRPEVRHSRSVVCVPKKVLSFILLRK